MNEIVIVDDILQNGLRIAEQLKNWIVQEHLENNIAVRQILLFNSEDLNREIYKNRIAELLFNDMFYRIKKYYNDSIPDPDGCKKKALEEQISSLKKEYKKKYIKYGIEFPEAIDKIEKQEDIENL